LPCSLFALPVTPMTPLKPEPVDLVEEVAGRSVA
jgi:hypothetical protein